MKKHFIVRTHQVFSAANKILGVEWMASHFKKSHRQVRRWAADPDHCECVSRDPLKLVQLMMESLQEAGREDVVGAGLRVFCEKLGYQVTPAEVASDRASSMMELMDINHALGQLAECLQEVLLDGILGPEESSQVVAHADAVIRQAMELKDAALKGQK